MKKIVAQTYAYFICRKISMPYFRTMMIFVGLIMFHFILIYVIFPIPQSLNPIRSGKSELVNWVSASIFLGLLYLLVSLIYKKRDLQQYTFTKAESTASLRKLLVYFIILFATICIVSTLHLRDKW